jgi:hypothetical protein
VRLGNILLCHKIFRDDQEAYGVKDRLVRQMFNESKTTGREQVDVTGLINMHTEANQVTHGLYNYIGKPEKLLKNTLYFR